MIDRPTKAPSRLAHYQLTSRLRNRIQRLEEDVVRLETAVKVLIELGDPEDLDSH